MFEIKRLSDRLVGELTETADSDILSEEYWIFIHRNHPFSDVLRLKYFVVLFYVGFIINPIFAFVNTKQETFSFFLKFVYFNQMII